MKELKREPGIYILETEIFCVGNEIKTICIPLYYHDNILYLLSMNENNNWEKVRMSLKNFDAVTEETIFDEVAKIRLSLSAIENSSIHKLVKLHLNYGQRYTSIYRPVFTEDFIDNYFVPYINNRPARTFYHDLQIEDVLEYSNRLRQLEIVLDDLDSVFKTIAPCRANKKAYGHALRNIILISCTEIDMMMKHIMERNHYKQNKDHYSTKDYIKLLNALRLNQYQVGFKRFNSSIYSPYWRWNNSATTKSLWWYDAYNEVKHDREMNFKRANLGNAINSVMAFAVLLIAQYGYRNELWSEHVGKVIHVIKEPQWELNDFYIDCSNGCEHISYPFP